LTSIFCSPICAGGKVYHRQKTGENVDLYIVNFEDVLGDEKVKFRPT